MTLRIDTPPNLDRSDIGLALFGTWWAGTPKRQQATVDALAASWQGRPWPDPGPLSYSVFSASDGDMLLHYSQWAGENAHYDTAWKDEVFAAIPGIEPMEVVGYRPYRSTELPARAQPPGCFVAVTVEFDGPDPQRQRDWVDGVFNAAVAAPQPPEGLIAAHFHLSVDGTRALNFAEWASEQAHIDTVDALGRDAVRSAASDFSGVKCFTFKRFHFQLHLAAS